MRFIPYEDSYIPKRDVSIEEFEDDQERPEATLVVGSSSTIVGSFSSMKENIANMCRSIEEIHTV